MQRSAVAFRAGIFKVRRIEAVLPFFRLREEEREIHLRFHVAAVQARIVLIDARRKTDFAAQLIAVVVHRDGAAVLLFACDGKSAVFFRERDGIASDGLAFVRRRVGQKHEFVGIRRPRRKGREGQTEHDRKHEREKRQQNGFCLVSHNSS